LGLLCLYLASCATLSSRLPFRYIRWETRQANLATIQRWKIKGALAVRSPEQAFSASFRWTQLDKAHYNIELFGPLGIGAIHIYGEPDKITLIDNKKQKLTARNADELMQRTLGWHLPIESLYYWIRGLPAPGQMIEYRFDPYHHLVALKQNQFRVDFQTYQSGLIDLPSRIHLQGRGLRIKIAISDWDY
jgi:outer membrane lipoprotein LolB